MKKTLGMMSVAVLMSAAGAMGGTTVPTFLGLGDLPGGSYESNPSGISHDGRVITGYSYGESRKKEIIRWTAETGLVSLGFPPSAANQDQDAVGISADGSVIFGSYNYSGTYLEFGVEIPYTASRGYFWTEAGLYTSVANPVERGSCEFRSMTDDGQTFFGGFMPVYPGPMVAGKWTASEGWTAIPGPFPASDADGDGSITWIGACSPDGSVLVGTWTDPDNGYYTYSRAFRWTAETGVVLLDGLTGGPDYPSYVFGVSDDGSVIVGNTSDGSPFIWKQGVGTTLLGDLPGGSSQGQGLSITADGKTVVGNVGGSGGNRGFIWDEVNGMRDLQNLLVSMGTPEVGTWTHLRSSRVSITPDGRFITGLGRDENQTWEGFLIDFGAPEVPTCPADFNGDDVRDVSDLFAYINAWLAKTTDADFNADTTVDVSDLFAYINAWLAGC